MPLLPHRDTSCRHRSDFLVLVSSVDPSSTSARQTLALIGVDSFKTRRRRSCVTLILGGDNRVSCRESEATAEVGDGNAGRLERLPVTPSIRAFRLSDPEASAGLRGRES